MTVATKGYEAQGDIEEAVRSARHYAYTFDQFVEQARELWIGELASEARKLTGDIGGGHLSIASFV